MLAYRETLHGWATAGSEARQGCGTVRCGAVRTARKPRSSIVWSLYGHGTGRGRRVGIKSGRTYQIPEGEPREIDMHTLAEISTTAEYRALADLTARSDTAAAVRSLTRSTNNVFQAGASESEVEACLWRAWSAVVLAAAETPHAQQDTLVTLLAAVQRKELVGGDLTVCKVQGRPLWKAMPLFGAVMRGAWDRGG